MHDMLKCNLCGGSSFSEHTEFLGASLRYRNLSYIYARCDACHSIIRLSGGAIDYTGYVTSQHIPKLPFRRFANFLATCEIGKQDNILDFGCGNGAMVSQLNDLGYLNIKGYEPYSPKNSQTLEIGEFSLVYLTHVFEHLTDFQAFFFDLDKATEAKSTIIVICPSSTRIPRLNSTCPFQVYTIHAPFHTVIPSDHILVDMFTKNHFELRFHIPHDVQWSGIWNNNRVWALLNDAVGGTKEKLMEVTLREFITSLGRSPLAFVDAMFLHVRDPFVSTFVFDRLHTQPEIPSR